MGVAARILRTWRDPRGMMRGHLAIGPREDRALAVLAGACLLAFVAQWPGLARAAHLDPTVPLDARIGGALMASIFVLPLLVYALAGLSRLLLRAAGARIDGYAARIALFWSFLAVTPLMLLDGLVAGMIGPGVARTLTGLAVFAVFLFLWGAALIEAARAPAADRG